MIFKETPLPGAFTIEPEPFEDKRGSFARSFCRREFEERGLSPDVVQCNISRNRRRGTLRGMHFQTTPYEEAKLVRCIRGALWQVIVDLRPDSATRGRWFGVELTGGDDLQLYTPEGFAHGFQTLKDETEIFYQMSNYYAPEAEAGFRYDDPAFAIDWPLLVSSISEKDENWPAFPAD
jgi:dTDP-4-dehydrorhamnose 3,5-epimerase